jgi:hypothetical protein
MQTNNVLCSSTGFNTSIEKRAPSTETDKSTLLGKRINFPIRLLTFR